MMTAKERRDLFASTLDALNIVYSLTEDSNHGCCGVTIPVPFNIVLDDSRLAYESPSQYPIIDNPDSFVEEILVYVDFDEKYTEPSFAAVWNKEPFDNYLFLAD